MTDILARLRAAEAAGHLYSRAAAGIKHEAFERLQRAVKNGLISQSEYERKLTELGL